MHFTNARALANVFFDYNAINSPDEHTSPKTMMTGLSYGEDLMILAWLV